MLFFEVFVFTFAVVINLIIYKNGHRINKKDHQWA